MKQSTNHLFMVEPAEFYVNPETIETNAYQVREGIEESPEEIFEKALQEFRAYRDLLVAHGAMITTAKGRVGSPDMVFPNWISTYDDGRMIIYPMHSPNRRAERTPEIVDKISQYYPKVIDWSAEENKGLALESTASIVADHVNKRAYSGLSKRTSEELVKRWADCMGYDVSIFETKSHRGIPVYHTDFLMYIGTGMAGVCAPCITDEAQREYVLKKLKTTHDVIIFTMEQLQANCANALEVVGAGGERMLTMSKTAYDALTDEQLGVMRKHYNKMIIPEIPTLEKYGGGSARCMLMELF